MISSLDGVTSAGEKIDVINSQELITIETGVVEVAVHLKR
jgi:hypothetical protein